MSASAPPDVVVSTSVKPSSSRTRKALTNRRRVSCVVFAVTVVVCIRAFRSLTLSGRSAHRLRDVEQVSDLLKDKERGLLTVASDASVFDAVKQMVDANV